LKKYLIIIFLFSAVKSLLSNEEIIHRYKVKISPDLSALYVEARFGDIEFYHLYAGSKFAAGYLQDLKFTKNGRTTSHSTKSHEISLERNAANATLSYQVDISRALKAGRSSGAYKVGEDIIFSPVYWLWRPLELEIYEHIEVEFEGTDSVNFSVPWRPLSENKYRIAPTPYRWSSIAAFGKISTDTINIYGSKIALAFLDGDYITGKQEIKKWIEGSARAVSQVYGRFPKKYAQIMIIPVGASREPVPFGMVVRGGGFTVQFFIDATKPIEDFIADWTATHELSHSLLPFVNRQQAWLSEGLATYYQYILMARDGRLSEQEAWQRIYNGFQKGINSSRNQTLWHTSQNMRQYRAFRNVYWSGAAILLKTDVALRSAAIGINSLDNVLDKLNTDLSMSYKTWDAEALIRKMDMYSKTTTFSEIYDTYIHSIDFPVDDNFLGELGILVKQGKIQIVNDAPLAHIRRNIIPSNQD
jgi:hypothetical protein